MSIFAKCLTRFRFFWIRLETTWFYSAIAQYAVGESTLCRLGNDLLYRVVGQSNGKHVRYLSGLTPRISRQTPDGL